MSAFKYGYDVKQPTIYCPTYEEATPMLSGHNDDIGTSEMVICNLTLEALHDTATAGTDISLSKRVDTSASDDTDKFPSKEVDIFASDDTDNFPSKEVDIFASDDTDNFPSKEADISASEDTDTFPKIRVVLFPSDDTDNFPSKEMDTSASDDTDKLSCEKADVWEKEKADIVPKNCSTHLNKWFCALLVVNLCMCIAAIELTIVVQFPRDLEIIQETQPAWGRNSSQSVCVQCVKLVQNPFSHLQADPLIDKLVKRIDDGFQMCCAENEGQMSALVEAITREQETKPVPRLDKNTGLKFVPVSAHKQLLAVDDRENDVTAEPYYGNGSEHFVARFNPRYTDPLTEHANGVTVLDTALQVQHSGVYYVYFSVNIAPRRHTRSHSVEFWNQNVHLTRPNIPSRSVMLLQTSHTACWDCKDHQESAFAGGTFLLKEGDLVQVCLTGLGLVQYRKESSFLGLILLSNSEIEN